MKVKKILSFIKENICSIAITFAFIFSISIACGEKYFILMLLITLLVLILTYLVKYLLLSRKQDRKFEEEFAYEIAQSLSCGFNLEQTYFHASRVLQKYKKSVFTLDEIRLDPSNLDVYGFKIYKDEIYSILCEDDFFYYSKGKYSLFLDTVLKRSNDMNDKTKRMKKSKRTFMLAIIVASLFMLLISIFNVSLSDVNKYVVLLPTSATIALAVLFEEIYEKISG